MPRTEIEVETNTIGHDEDQTVENGMSTSPRITDGSFEDIDREMSIAGSGDASSDNEEYLMTMDDAPLNKWRVFACFVWCFTFGYSDAVPGAILPTIEAYYNVNYAVVSCIWIGNACGFIFVAMLSYKIEPWLGKRWSLALCASLLTTMYALVSTGTKFPVIVIAFFIGGIGGGIGDGQTNIFLARFKNKASLLLIHHGVYGVGATVSPLLATTAINNGLKWHLFYITLVGLMGLNIFSFAFTFKGADQDLDKWNHDKHEIPDEADSDVVVSQTQETDGDIQMRSFSKEFLFKKSKPSTTESGADWTLMKAALKNRATWLLAIFVFVYQGSEVAIAGWIVTFLLQHRHADPETVGYVASGFWGGLTIGRLGLTGPLHKYIGVRKGVTLISVISMVLVGLVWIIPNVIADAVIVSIAGIFIGPNYPLMVSLITMDGLIPRKIHVISMTILTAFGSCGGAFFPFMVGLLNEAGGTFLVLPVFLGLYLVMLIMWIALPNMELRRDNPGKTSYTLWEGFW